MSITGVFIDGGYLDKVQFSESKGIRVDYQKLVAEMTGTDELLRAYYYHCLPYQSNPPTPEDSARYASMHRFITKLQHMSRFEVRLGKLALKGTDANGKRIFVQKRVDNMVGVDMALLAAKKRIDKVAFLTGDSDYVPTVEAVKREGVIVTLWHGRIRTENAPSRDLYEICDERRELTPEVFKRLARH